MSLRNSGEARIYTCICHPSKYSTTLQKLTVISTDINCSFLKSFCIFLLQDSPVILFQGGMFIAWKNFNDTIGHIVLENLWQPYTKWKLLLGLDQVWFFILVNRKIIAQQHYWIYLFYLILNFNYCFFINLLVFKYFIKYLYAWTNDFN